MTLRIVTVAGDTLELWRAIHNQIIPTAPLSPIDVAERATRNRLTLAYEGEVLVGNATLRPPSSESSTATVIVRVLPQFRRRGYGSAYLASMLTAARSLGAARIETVVLASNEDGLTFALANGFVELDRYTLEGDTVPFVDLYLAI
jgi:GNAT superfamily N-acetyltransferase